MNTPRNSRAGTRGRPFELGNAGRAKGSRNRVTLAIEALLEGQHEALTQAAIDKALEGDTTALRLCLDRLAPARKDAPISIDLPPVKTAADTLAASALVVEALGAGGLTPDEAARVIAMLSAHRAIIETSDLEQRLAALEARGPIK